MSSLELEDPSLEGLFLQLPRVIINSREDNTVKNYHYAHQQWSAWARCRGLSPLPAKDGYVKDSVSRLLSVSRSLGI